MAAVCFRTWGCCKVSPKPAFLATARKSLNTVSRFSWIDFCELKTKSPASGLRSASQAFSAAFSSKRELPFTLSNVCVDGNDPFSRAIWTCSLLKLISDSLRLHISWRARAVGHGKQEHSVLSRPVFLSCPKETVQLLCGHVADSRADLPHSLLRHPHDVLEDRRGHRWRLHRRERYCCNVAL